MISPQTSHRYRFQSADAAVILHRHPRKLFHGIRNLQSIEFRQRFGTEYLQGRARTNFGIAGTFCNHNFLNVMHAGCILLLIRRILSVNGHEKSGKQ